MFGGCSFVSFPAMFLCGYVWGEMEEMLHLEGKLCNFERKLTIYIEGYFGLFLTKMSDKIF